MRVLHLVKTADGADWAAAQAAELVKLGVHVHVALPHAVGRAVGKWENAGAVLHITQTDLPIRSPWSLPVASRQIRSLVARVRPDVIHSHFFGPTILARWVLGPDHRTPRLFQVPGPLHLEHRFWRNLELSTAGPSDYWVASSRCILSHYRRSGVSEQKLFLSYYGIPTGACSTVRTGLLRRKYNIADNVKVVGNANFIYPPKWYLGQRVGLKAHEDVIDALGLVIAQRKDVVGVLIGGGPPGSEWYQQRLQERARNVGSGRILMTGYLPVDEIRRMWPDFDVAVHVPLSENCGGIGEPMLAKVPVIAGKVGGLPELIIDGVTGTLVPIRQPGELSSAILRVLSSPGEYSRLAANAFRLASGMAADRRLGEEVLDIYCRVLMPKSEPQKRFDPMAFLDAPVARADQAAL